MAQLRAALDEAQLRVTTRHTDAIIGKVGDVEHRVNLVLGLVVAVFSVLLFTNGAMAYFTWRLTSTLCP